MENGENIKNIKSINILFQNFQCDLKHYLLGNEKNEKYEFSRDTDLFSNLS
jgi:hypothetical protein